MQTRRRVSRATLQNRLLARKAPKKIDHYQIKKEIVLLYNSNIIPLRTVASQSISSNS